MKKEIQTHLGLKPSPKIPSSATLGKFLHPGPIPHRYVGIPIIPCSLGQCEEYRRTSLTLTGPQEVLLP